MALFLANGSIGQSGGEYVGQVVYAQNNSVISYTFSSNASATTAVTVVTSPSITPQSTNSRFLVYGQTTGWVSQMTINYEWDMSLYRNQSGNASFIGGNTNTSYWKGSSVHASGQPGIESGQTNNFMYVDHPNNTTALTYQIEVRGGESTTYYFNRGRTGSAAYHFSNTGGSYIVVQELCTV